MDRLDGMEADFAEFMERVRDPNANVDELRGLSSHSMSKPNQSKRYMSGHLLHLRTSFLQHTSCMMGEASTLLPVGTCAMWEYHRAHLHHTLFFPPLQLKFAILVQRMTYSGASQIGTALQTSPYRLSPKVKVMHSTHQMTPTIYRQICRWMLMMIHSCHKRRPRVR